MPRGVYPRKKKDGSETSTQASSGASKAKKTWKAKSKTAAPSISTRSSGSTDQFQLFRDLTNYLTAIGDVRAKQQSPNSKLDQEFEGTISNLRNLREQIFSVSTEEVIAQEPANTRQTAQAVAAPVPFNPPQFSGQVQQ